MAVEAGHIPVMPVEVGTLLSIRPGSVHVDGTLGLGGHALLAAQALGPTGRLIGIDQDAQAIIRARERLAQVPCRLDIVQANFSQMIQVLDGLGIARVDTVLFDLGVSSLQLDDGERGFSFRVEAALDMRMNRSEGVTACDLVNTLSERELADIIFRYGEERFSRRIASAITRARVSAPLRTTTELAALILRSLPKGYQRGALHPATRTFQALRIAVNRELDSLSEGIEKAFSVLNPGGRLCVIAFHSLEDRIVKEMFRLLARTNQGRLVIKKPLMPERQEAVENSRARSARVRCLERVV